jgi:hypothetical protein
MKKTISVFMAAICVLAAGITASVLSKSPATGEAAPTSVTVYLVGGEGSTVGGAEVGDVEDMYLKFARAVTGAPGEALPAAEKTGYVFDGWQFGLNGELFKVTGFPITDGEIYYADWRLAGENPYYSSEPIVTEDITLADLYFANITETAYPKANQMRWEDKGHNYEYSIKGIEVQAGDIYQLKTQNGIISHATGGGDNTTGQEYPFKVFPGATGGQGYSLNSDAAKPNITYNYFEPMNAANSAALTPTPNKEDSSGKSGYYVNNCGGVRVKQSGRYNIYIMIWNNGGWLDFYAEPV